MNSYCIIILIALGVLWDLHPSSERQAHAQSGLPLPDLPPELSPDTGVRSGRWTLAFAIPSGPLAYSGYGDAVGSVGAWRLLTHDIALGIVAGLRIAQQESSLTSSELTLSPSVKYYTYQRGPIALFGIAQLHVRFYSDGDPATTTNREPGVGERYEPDEDIRLRAQLGFGAEWFATPSLSLAGHMGLQLDLLQPGDQGFGLETFTSNLSLQIYF